MMFLNFWKQSIPQILKYCKINSLVETTDAYIGSKKNAAKTLLRSEKPMQIIYSLPRKSIASPRLTSLSILRRKHKKIRAKAIV